MFDELFCDFNSCTAARNDCTDSLVDNGVNSNFFDFLDVFFIYDFLDLVTEVTEVKVDVVGVVFGMMRFFICVLFELSIHLLIEQNRSEQ